MWWESPGRWMPWIQLIYDNSFSSVFEYEESFKQEKIDWRSVIGERCPLCGGRGCWREISPYRRTVIELFPFRTGKVDIARFQCRKHKRTFSMLPNQLAPYHLYTIESMILAVQLWCEVYSDGEGSASAAVNELPGECQVTPWLLRHWLGVVVLGFHRAHSVLCRWYDLSGIHSGDRLSDRLDEILAYIRSLGSRGPPSRSVLRDVIRRYSRHTGHHLLGIPSQER